MVLVTQYNIFVQSDPLCMFQLFPQGDIPQLREQMLEELKSGELEL